MAGKSAVNLDTVLINIESNAGKASSNISRLAKHLGTLRDSLKGGFNNLNKLAVALDSLVPALHKVGSATKNLKAIDEISQSLSQLKDIKSPTGLKNAVDSLEKLPNVIGKMDTKTFENLARVSNELAQSLTPIADKMQQIAAGYSAFSKVQNTFGKSASTVNKYTKQQKSILSGLRPIVSKLGSGFKSLSKGIAAAFGRNAWTYMKKFHSKTKQILLSLLGTRTLFTMIRKAAAEYEAFDQELQDFSQNVWRAFGAQLAPVIYHVMDLFKQFVRVIYSVVLALTGIDLIAKANEKAMAGWGKASKDTLGNLQKFDDLNVVEFPKDNGGEDNKLIELDKIDLSPIQKVIDWVRKLKAEIIDAWNSGEWYGVGEVLAEGINMGAAAIINNIGTIRDTFFEIGRDFADLLNGIIQNTNWGNLGKAATEGLKLLPDFFTEVLSTINWEELGKGINEYFKGFDAVEVVKSFGRAIKTGLTGIGTILAQQDWGAFGHTLGEVIKTVFNGIAGFLDTIPWKTVGEKVREAILSIDWKGVWDSIVNLATTAFKGLEDFISSLFDLDATELTVVKTAIVGIGIALTTYKIVDGIDNMVKSLSKLSKIKNWASNISTLLSTLGKSKTTLTENPLLNGDILKMKKVNDLSKYNGSSVAGVTGALDSTGTLSNKVKSSGNSFDLTNTKSVLSGIKNLAAIIGSLALLIIAMGALTKIPGFTELTSSGIDELVKIFSGLSKIILPLTAFSLGAIVLGMIGISTVLQGVGGLALIIGGITGLVTAIGFILSLGELSSFLSGGIDMLKTTFNGLYDIILPLAAVSLLVVGLGFATPAVVLSGILGLAAIIGGIELILIALGALKQIPGFEWIVGEGGQVLSQLGEIIGNFGGSIIAGFTDKAFEGLDSIGTHLTNFMTNAQGFFDGVANIKEDSSKGVKNIANAILAISAANVMDAIASWLTGDSSLTSFGKELAGFAPYLMSYAKKVKGLDGSVVTASADAAKALSELANNLPNQRGMLSWFVGDNTIDKFGKKLPSFGENLKKYAKHVKGLDSSIVEKSAIAAGALAELASNLPNQGGIISWFTGDNTLDKFGKILDTFGTYFKNYYGKIKKIDYSHMNNVTTALNSIVETMKTIKSKDLTTTINSFGKALDDFGPKIDRFFKSWFNTTSGAAIGKAFGEAVGNGVASGVKQNASIRLKLTESGGSTLSTYRLQGYATGGFPESGQYFYARENGIPEMVGAIGTKTAVANNTQIVEAVSVGVEQAMLNALSRENFSPNIIVNIGNKKVYEGQQAYNKMQQNKYGTINLY